MKNFVDLAHEDRFAFLQAIAQAGSFGSRGYFGPYVAVLVPNPTGHSWDGVTAIDAVAEAHGLIRDDDGYFFPLGSDRYPWEHQHDGPAYCGPGRRGYTLTVNYRPREEAA